MGHGQGWYGSPDSLSWVRSHCSGWSLGALLSGAAPGQTEGESPALEGSPEASRCQVSDPGPFGAAWVMWHITESGRLPQPEERAVQAGGTYWAQGGGRGSCSQMLGGLAVGMGSGEDWE